MEWEAAVYKTNALTAAARIPAFFVLIVNIPGGRGRVRTSGAHKFCVEFEIMRVRVRKQIMFHFVVGVFWEGASTTIHYAFKPSVLW